MACVCMLGRVWGLESPVQHEVFKNSRGMESDGTEVQSVSWEGYLSSPGLTLLICKMGLIPNGGSTGLKEEYT